MVRSSHPKKTLLGLLLVVVGVVAAPLSAEDEAKTDAGAGADGEEAPAVDVEAIEEALGKLERAVENRDAELGAAVVSRDGRLLAGRQPDAPRNPASNMKVVTAWAALRLLGPDHRYLTGLYGRIDGDRVARLSLRGDGDPSLERRHLWEMVERLHRAGVRRIGDVVVDQSAFAPPHVPPAFDSQPNEWAAFRAPVAAVSLARNTVMFEVRAGRKGRPARVSVVPSVVAVEGRVTTSDADAPDAVQLSMDVRDGRLHARVGGTVPVGSPTVRFWRRVDDPTLLAGRALVEICEAIGITVEGEVKAGKKKGKLLSAHRSRRLAALLLPMGKRSNNFTAETVFKSLGLAEGAEPADFERSAATVESLLEAAGLPTDGVEIHNGSGLFEGGRLTPRLLATLLAKAQGDPRVGPELATQLSVAGVDGTLRHRMRALADSRAVRAKTGTLAAVSALSGYAFAPEGEPALAFSLLVGDARGQATAVRKDLDAFAEALAAIVEEG